MVYIPGIINDAKKIIKKKCQVSTLNLNIPKFKLDGAEDVM